MIKKFSELKAGDTLYALEGKHLIECDVISNEYDSHVWYTDGGDRYADSVKMVEYGHTLVFSTKDGEKHEMFYTDLADQYEERYVWPLTIFSNKESALHTCTKRLEEYIQYNEEKLNSLINVIDADKTYLKEIKQKYEFNNL